MKSKNYKESGYMHDLHLLIIWSYSYSIRSGLGMRGKCLSNNVDDPNLVYDLKHETYKF